METNQLAHHLAQLLAMLRNVEDVVAHGVAAGVRTLPATLHALVNLRLVAHALQEEVLLRRGTVVVQDNDCPHSMPCAHVKVAIEPLEESIMLVEPNLVGKDEPHGIEACLMGKRQLAFGMREPFLESPFLPDVDIAAAVGWHEVDATDPRLLPVPLPRLFLRPRTGARRSECRDRHCHSHHYKTQSPHRPTSYGFALFQTVPYFIGVQLTDPA